MQVPHDEKLQQTLSTQWPVPHSWSEPQDPPAAVFGWQLPFGPVQKLPAVHSLSDAQVNLHALAPQMYGTQLWFAGVVQLPLPEQNEGGV